MPNQDQYEDPDLPGTGISDPDRNRRLFGDTPLGPVTSTGGGLGAGGAGLPPPPPSLASVTNPGGAPTSSAIPSNLSTDFPVAPFQGAASAAGFGEGGSRSDRGSPIPTPGLPPPPPAAPAPHRSTGPIAGSAPSSSPPPAPRPVQVRTPQQVDFNDAFPSSPPPPTAEMLANPDANREAIRAYRENADRQRTWLSQQAQLGNTPINLPPSLQGVWNNMAAYGPTLGRAPNLDIVNGKVWDTTTNPATGKRGYWRPMTPDELQARSMFRTFRDNPVRQGMINAYGADSPGLAFARSGFIGKAQHGEHPWQHVSVGGQQYLYNPNQKVWMNGYGQQISTPTGGAEALAKIPGMGGAGTPGLPPPAPKSDIPTTVNSGRARFIPPTTIAAGPAAISESNLTPQTATVRSVSPAATSPIGSTGIAGSPTTRSTASPTLPSLDSGHKIIGLINSNPSLPPPAPIAPPAPIGRAAALGSSIPRRAPTPEDHEAIRVQFGSYPGQEDVTSPSPTLDPGGYNFNPFGPRGKQWIMPRV